MWIEQTQSVLFARRMIRNESLSAVFEEGKEESAGINTKRSIIEEININQGFEHIREREEDICQRRRIQRMNCKWWGVRNLFEERNE